MKTLRFRICMVALLVAVGAAGVGYVRFFPHRFVLNAIQITQGRYSAQAVLYRIDCLRTGAFDNEDVSYFLEELPSKGHLALLGDAELWCLLKERPALTNALVKLERGALLLEKEWRIGRSAWDDYYGGESSVFGDKREKTAK